MNTIKTYSPHPCDRYLGADIARLEDDGCPNILTMLDVELPAALSIQEWGQGYNPARPSRYYSCERCGWTVWHPIRYCHDCGGRMRIISGLATDLTAFRKDNNLSDGGF